MMKTPSLLLAALLATATSSVIGQSTVVDTSKIGPQVGATVPAFSGTDQFGTPRTLSSTMGSKGAMVVFFRSADW